MDRSAFVSTVMIALRDRRCIESQSEDFVEGSGFLSLVG
jgi:hypothetical protein